MQPWWALALLNCCAGAGMTVEKKYSISVKNVSSYQNSFEMLIKDLTRWKKEGWRVILLSASRTRASRLASDLREYDLKAFCPDPPVGEEEDAHLEDFIQDEEAGVPVDEAGRQLLRRELFSVLKSLTPREERVIALRFGLEDGRAHTLEELGKEFNVTRERVRQIEAKALRKLRHPSRAKRLRDYLDE